MVLPDPAGPTSLNLTNAPDYCLPKFALNFLQDYMLGLGCLLVMQVTYCNFFFVAGLEPAL